MVLETARHLLKQIGIERRPKTRNEVEEFILEQLTQRADELPQGTEVHPYAQITPGGYKEPIIMIPEKAYIIASRRGSRYSLELGPEAVDASIRIKTEGEKFLGKPVQVIWVTPAGASEYVQNRLLQTSGALAIAANQEGINTIIQTVRENSPTP